MDIAIELLRRQSLFSALTDETLVFLAQRAGTAEVDADDYFFREKDSATSLFVLEQGRAEALKSRDGVTVRLAELVPGDCFGEVAFMGVLPRIASVRAIEPSVALSLTNHDLLALHAQDVEQFALIMMNIGREVCRRLHAANERLFRIAAETDGV